MNIAANKCQMGRRVHNVIIEFLSEKTMDSQMVLTQTKPNITKVWIKILIELIIMAIISFIASNYVMH